MALRLLQRRERKAPWAGEMAMAGGSGLRGALSRAGVEGISAVCAMRALERAVKISGGGMGDLTG